jgi:hypothetical protein
MAEEKNNMLGDRVSDVTLFSNGLQESLSE